MEQEEDLKFGHIKRIEFENIRGFTNFVLNLQSQDELRKKLVIIGRNGMGKSTILRALALALSPQSDATALLSSSQGSLITQGEKYGAIRIQVTDLVDASSYNIVVNIEGEGNRFSLFREVDLGRKRLNFFVCGYGAGRSLTGVTSDKQYRQIESVGSLFDYERRLLNSEITLRRLYDFEGQKIFKPALSGIKRLLELSDEHDIEFQMGGGVQLSGPGFGKSIPLDAWADGYRLTFNWVIDLYGRAMQAGAISEDGGIRGVLLVDEIEQHLHPSMQSDLINQLHEVFPELQIFATTHSPLTALGVGRENIVSLQREAETNRIRFVNVPQLSGYSAEDVLVEEALFGTDPYPKSTQDDLTRYRQLVQKTPEELSGGETQELNQLLSKLGESGESKTQDDPIDKKLDEVLRILKNTEGK